MTEIRVSEDGFYHPATEDEIADLVRKAAAEGLQIRCRGSAHSVARAIYTDPADGGAPVANRVSVHAPPAGPHLNLLLDRLDGLEWIDEANGIVEVEAGIHLGADPNDAHADLERSLLYQAFQKGWTFRDLGGITHQTVGGFLATGSSGGSLMYGVEDNLLAFRVVDGKGDARWIDRVNDEDLFNAVGVSMGLLGIVTKVRLALTPTYSIYGQEVTTPIELPDCTIDLFGPGRDGKPSMREFFEKTPYSRLLWWPQKGAERVATWQASAGASLPGSWDLPYRLFDGSTAGVEQVAGAIFLTLVGNVDDLPGAMAKLDRTMDRFEDAAELLLEKMGLPDFAADLLAKILAGGAGGATDLAVTALGPVLRDNLPDVFAKVIGLFQEMSKPGEPTVFMDHAWRSLPMDNGADDFLLGTEFTELWIPLAETERSMNLLLEHFERGGLDATGLHATELYAAKESRFWLSPSHGGPTFRVDPFWYMQNSGDPTVRGGFFDGFWQLFRDAGVPFRLHWGKFLPEHDLSDWAAYYREQYERWDDFMALREERDPDGVFLTEYWRRHLMGA